MTDTLLQQQAANAIPITVVPSDEFDTWIKQQKKSLQRWLDTNRFNATGGRYCIVPDDKKHLQAVIVGGDTDNLLWTLSDAAARLPQAAYYLDEQTQARFNATEKNQLLLGWALGAYQYDRYQQTCKPSAQLVAPDDCDIALVQRLAAATALTRDLINMPAADMMPQHLAAVMQDLAKRYKARFSQIVGDTLLKKNYPTIHTVGRASEHPPRLLDLRWGDASHPKVTLVGKGVCFDSGGLDIKPASGMRVMKKDMGGAAHVLGLAQAIMDAALPIRLRVLIPAVENAISGRAYRPGDVIRTRQGLTVEIDNTDAEGRLVLADALTEASREKPDLIMDFATLTGAARVAVGTEMAAFFCNDRELANALQTQSEQVQDPIWQLPLHQPYRGMLDSYIADLTNSASTGYAGATTAALFLQAFVAPQITWAHFDMMAWNLRSKPGRPEGGEAMGLRAAYHYLLEFAAQSGE